jgi:2',3'-cyclic-nucleotide 2'-phosphodiesterase (5'-nucleotidase family)
MLRRWTVLALVAVFAASLGTTASAQPAPETRVTIFHDTHLHGNLEGPGGITLAHYVGLIRQLRADLPVPANSLFVGGGDDVGPSLMASEFRGHHTAEALSMAGLTANTFGNHEFDFGQDNLRDVIRRADYPYVTANVRNSLTGGAFGAEYGVSVFIIRQVGGVQFGLTGLAPADTANLAPIGPNVTILDPVEAMREVVPQMRAAGAQVVVLLSHLCGDDTERLVALVNGIDVAVGDHCSRALEEPRVINNAIVSRRGDEMRLVGQLDLYLSNARITRHAYTQHTVRSDGPTDPAIAALVERYNGELDAKLSEEVGETVYPLDATRDVVRGEESAAGNLIADALGAWAESDVAIQNGGGIRGDRVFGPGVLIKRDIQEMLPFSNYGVVLRVSGVDLLAALENGVSRVEQGDGRFPQVSGMAFAWEPREPPGSRVQQVLVGGEPLEPDQYYTVATNDFVAAGGDGYEALERSEVLVPAAAGPQLSSLVIDYIQEQGTVTVDVEGRIIET